MIFESAVNVLFKKLHFEVVGGVKTKSFEKGKKNLKPFITNL